jgi:hypothetical protein
VRAIPCEPSNFSDKIKIFDLLNRPNSLNIERFHDRLPDDRSLQRPPSNLDDIINFQFNTLWAVKYWQKAIHPDVVQGVPMFVLELVDGQNVVLSGYSAEVKREIEKISCGDSGPRRGLRIEDVALYLEYDRKPTEIKPRSNDSVFHIYPMKNSILDRCVSTQQRYESIGQLRIGEEIWYVVKYDPNPAYKGVLFFGIEHEFEVV